MLPIVALFVVAVTFTVRRMLNPRVRSRQHHRCSGRNSSEQLSARLVTRMRMRSGAARIINWRCSRRRTQACWATSTTRASTTMASRRASPRRLEIHGAHRRRRGALHDYQIGYTFGVYPLQQYLIAMPGGRLQALGIAWDTRPRDRGGQRWFSLYPGQKITADDSRHSTGSIRTGTTCAPIAIRPTCARTTTLALARFRLRTRRSMCRARLVTAPARITFGGQRNGAIGKSSTRPQD